MATNNSVNNILGGVNALGVLTSTSGGVIGTTAGTANQLLVMDGAGTAITWSTGVPGSSGVTSLTGTTNQITASASTGAVTLSLPQDIATTSTVEFSILNLTNAHSPFTYTFSIYSPSTADSCIFIGAGNATSSSMTGANNIGTGLASLLSLTSGSFNTTYGVGAGQLISTSSDSTHIGCQAGQYNSAGDNLSIGFRSLMGVNGSSTGGENVAIGPFCLTSLTTGVENVAIGWSSGESITIGSSNVLIGYLAGALLSSRTDNCFIGASAGAGVLNGIQNIGIGSLACGGNVDALSSNIAIGYQCLAGLAAGLGVGHANVAIGNYAGVGINNGEYNVLIGYQSAYQITGGTYNICVGHQSALSLSSGTNNTLIGYGSGAFLTTGTNNIILGAHPSLSSNMVTTTIIGYDNLGNTQQTACFIDGISGKTTGLATILPALCDANGQLGTISSLREEKENIESMGDRTKSIYDLEPVCFTYKAHKDQKYQQYGLIAEDVEKAFPDLASYDTEGKLRSVRYHDLPVIILNEMKKQKLAIDSLQAANDNLQEANTNLYDQIAILVSRIEALEDNSLL